METDMMSAENYSVNGSRHRTVSELKILGKLCLQIVCLLLSVEHAFQRWNTVKVLFKNNAENKAGRLVPDLFVFWKSFIWGKSKWSAP